jgi:hypothetical protein
MPRLTPDLVRRLDRLSRHAHGFHRYAHHPLCAAYAAEVVRLGPRVRVCRGCLLAGLGLGAGVLAGGWAPLAGPWPQLVLLATALAGWAAASGVRSAAAKLGSRFTPVAAAAFLAVQGLRAGPCGWARAALVLLAALAFQRRYRRRGPHRGPCAACPERPGPGTCSGFSPILRREKAFRRLAGRMMGGAE